VDFLAIKLEIGWNHSTVLPQTSENFTPRWRLLQFLKLNVVADFQIELFNDRSGKADGEAVTPFSDFHGAAPDIHTRDVYPGAFIVNF
jgi:hypothetical protein